MASGNTLETLRDDRQEEEETDVNIKDASGILQTVNVIDGLHLHGTAAGALAQECDWDPFVVWRRSVDGGPTAASPDGPSGADGSWKPFDVWASHFHPDTERR